MVRLVLVAFLLLSGPVYAQTKLAGELQVSEGVVSLKTEDGTHTLTGRAAEMLARFPSGWAVEVRGEARRGAFEATHLLSPRRESLTLISLEEDGRTVVRDAQGRLVEVAGRTNLLKSGRKVMADVFHSAATPAAPERAFVVAVEAMTTGGWTLMHSEPKTFSMLSGFVRGADRAVWVTREREDGWRYARRGDWEGWIDPAGLTIGVEFDGSYSGAANALPQ